MSKSNIDFILKKNLIYYVGNIKRLCISILYEQTMFELAQNENTYAKHHQIYHNLKTTIFMFKFSRIFRVYIKHCSNCELNHIKRHFTYEKLMFIKKSIMSFRIITMNFILVLSKKLNVMLIMICKSFKRVTLIFEKFT